METFKHAKRLNLESDLWALAYTGCVRDHHHHACILTIWDKNINIAIKYNFQY